MCVEMYSQYGTSKQPWLLDVDESATPYEVLEAAEDEADELTKKMGYASGTIIQLNRID